MEFGGEREHETDSTLSVVRDRGDQSPRKGRNIKLVKHWSRKNNRVLFITKTSNRPKRVKISFSLKETRRM